MFFSGHGNMAWCNNTSGLNFLSDLSHNKQQPPSLPYLANTLPLNMTWELLDDNDEEEDGEKICSNISQILLYCSLSYSSTYIGTPKFLTKVLWVYNHLKSDFFSTKKLLNVI